MNCGVETPSSTKASHQKRSHHAAMRVGACAVTEPGGESSAGHATIMATSERSMRQPPNSTGQRPPASCTRVRCHNDSPTRESVRKTRAATMKRQVSLRTLEIRVGRGGWPRVEERMLQRQDFTECVSG